MRRPNRELIGKLKTLIHPLRRITEQERTRRNALVDPPQERAVTKRKSKLGPKPAWSEQRNRTARRGPQLVTDPGKVRRIVHGDYVAEIAVNRKTDPVLFHYLITKKDSPTILDWGQTVSVHAAEGRARVALKRLSVADNLPEAQVAAD